MLQQTTVSTVKKHYHLFLKTFPTIEDLSRATVEEVCANWQGLGYYRRARNLHKAAQFIVNEYGGNFPKEREELKKIPGIGDYTASALIAIGRDEKDLAIDANLERVIARLFKIEEKKGPKLQKEIRTRFENNFFDLGIKKYSSREVNEALMDLGRVYCQARRADCLLCPLKKKCLTYNSDLNPVTLPIVDKKKEDKKNLELHLLRIIVRKGNKILGYEKSDEEWLSGQVEIPTFILKSVDKDLKQYPILDYAKYSNLPCIKTAITKYKIYNYIIECNHQEFKKLASKISNLNRYKFFNSDVQKVHFSTTTLKVFKKLNLEML